MAPSTRLRGSTVGCLLIGAGLLYLWGALGPDLRPRLVEHPGAAGPPSFGSWLSAS